MGWLMGVGDKRALSGMLLLLLLLLFLLLLLLRLLLLLHWRDGWRARAQLRDTW